MNNFELIEQIRARLPLWERTIGDKTDALTKEQLWDEVSDTLHTSKDIVKSRWKNLRDSYRKLIRKGDNVTEPKWPYYNAMAFMRDITSNATPKVVDISRRSTLNASDFTLGVMRSDGDETIDPLDGEQRQNKREAKRHAAEDLVTQIFETETEKSADGDRAPRVSTAYETDDDYQFLLSLHAHLKQVPGNRKLPLRMKIEQLVYDEIYRRGY